MGVEITPDDLPDGIFGDGVEILINRISSGGFGHGLHSLSSAWNGAQSGFQACNAKARFFPRSAAASASMNRAPLYDTWRIVHGQSDSVREWQSPYLRFRDILERL
jgi:hypothetical protein